MRMNGFPAQPGQGLGGFVMRVVLVLAGLIFLLSLLLVTMLLLGVWSVRALWARLRGRPVQPMVYAYWRRSHWQRFDPRGRVDPTEAADVIDVQARPVAHDDQAAQRLDR